MKSLLIHGVRGLVAIALAASSLGVAAQWKWRDAQGRVQYSDLPPPASVPAKDVLQSPIAQPAPRVVNTPAATAASAPAKAASSVDPALEAKRKQAEQQEQAKQKAQEAQQAQLKAQNCERAQAYMRTLESGVRIARTQANGEREYLDDAARARETEQTRQSMQSNCR